MPGADKKIKVLFLTKWYPNAADPQLGIFIKKHAQAAALYADVSVLYISPFIPGVHITDFYLTEENRVRQFLMYYRRSSFAFLNLWRYYRAYKKGYKAVLKNAGLPDILHAHVLTRPGVFAMLLSLRYKIPYVITEHWTGFADHRFRNKPAWYQWITRMVANRASMITVVSQSLKNALLQNGMGKRMRIIPNVVDLPVLKEKTDNGRKKFLTVADLLDNQKNISGAIRMAARLAKHRSDFEYHIIGGGPDEEMLRTLAQKSGILDTFVFFHGRKTNEEVYDFMSTVDFVLVNSLTETFSVVTAESLACGKPVVATISGGPEEIITKETGILVEKNNENQLEDAVVYMLSHHQQYHPEVLRSAVKEKFSRETVGSQFYRLYLDVAGERK